MIPKTNKEFSRLAGSGLPRNAGKLHNDPAKYQSGMQRPTAARGQEAQAQQSAEQAAAKDTALAPPVLSAQGQGFSQRPFLPSLRSAAIGSQMRIGRICSERSGKRRTKSNWSRSKTVWKRAGALTDVPTRATAATSRQLQEQLMEHEQRATPAAVNAIGGSDAYQLLKGCVPISFSIGAKRRQTSSAKRWNTPA